MFIRTDTRINVTIFDVSQTDLTSKKTFFDQTVEMYKSGLTSLNNRKETSRLVIPSYLSKKNSTFRTCNDVMRRALFNDILGSNRYVNRTSYEHSKIFDSRTTNGEILTDQGIKKLQERKSVKPIGGFDQVLHTPEKKTKELVDKHHSKLLKKANKKIETAEDSYFNQSNVGRGYIYNILTGERECVGKETLVCKYDPSSTFLKDVNKILFIDAVYSLSELEIVFDQLYLLNSKVSGIQNTHDASLKSLGTLFDANKMCNDVLYEKYNILDYTAFWRSNTNLEGNGSFVNSIDSVCKENQKLMNVDTELNMFIPVTFVWFMEETENLFNTLSNIVIEQHVVKNPRFFISKIASGELLGCPEFQECELRRQKAQTSSELLPDIAGNMYNLKVTLTSIPSAISNRLLKSKLKSVNNIQLTETKYGEQTYFIPKSILEGDFMSSFHFFTKERADNIRVADKVSKFYRILFDDRLDISYYTHFIQNGLVNRFASRYYRGTLYYTDFICSPSILISEPASLSIIIKNLERRQETLKDRLNDELNIISTEMLTYEKSLLIKLCIFKQLNIPFLVPTYNTSKREDPFKTTINKLMRNEWHFSDDIVTEFSDNIKCSMKYAELRPTTESFLMQSLFYELYNVKDEQIYEMLLKWTEEFKISVDNTMKQYKKSREEMSKLFLSILGGGPKHYNPELSEALFEFEKRLCQPLYEYNPPYALINAQSKENPSDVIVTIMKHIYLSNIRREILGVINTFRQFIQCHAEQFMSSSETYINEDGKSPELLTDSTSQQELFRRLSYWNITTDKNYDILKKLLQDNSTTTKIDTIPAFVGYIVDYFNQNYISSIKEVKT